MPDTAFTTSQIGYAYGSVVALHSLDLSVPRGRTGLVGANGAWAVATAVYSLSFTQSLPVASGEPGLSALAIQYRDIRFAMQFVVQLLMYAAPVVWPASLITERLPHWGGTVRMIYGLYPMVGVIEGFRAAMLGKTAMPWDLIGMGTLSAVVLFVTGAFYFRRMERIFADVA